MLAGLGITRATVIVSWTVKALRPFAFSHKLTLKRAILRKYRLGNSRSARFLVVNVCNGEVLGS